MISLYEILSDREKKILTNPDNALRYARTVIRGRWPEAEHIFIKDPEKAYIYAMTVIKGRFPAGEDIILTSPKYIYSYATDVLKKRWLDGEKALLKIVKNQLDFYWLTEYLRYVVFSKPGNRWMAGEVLHRRLRDKLDF